MLHRFWAERQIPIRIVLSLTYKELCGKARGLTYKSRQALQVSRADQELAGLPQRKNTLDTL